MTSYLLFGSAGSRERAEELAARYRGVFWSPEFRDLIVVDAHGLIRLMQGGGAREDGGETTVWPCDGVEIVLSPLHSGG